MSKKKDERQSDYQARFSAAFKGEDVPKQKERKKLSPTERHKLRMAKMSQAERNERARKIASQQRNPQQNNTVQKIIDEEKNYQKAKKKAGGYRRK